MSKVSFATRAVRPACSRIAARRECAYDARMHRVSFPFRLALRRLVTPPTSRTMLVMGFIGCASSTLAAGLAPPQATSLVHADLMADVASIQPGSTFRLGVHLTMKEGWHINWINPGDAGLAPSIAWKLPPVFKAGIVEWPLPARFVTGPLVIFGYEGDVLLVSDVHVPADVPAGGNVELGADVSWLACAGECVPGSVTVRLELPVEATSRPDPPSRSQFEATEARWPGPALAWKLDAWIEETNTVVLEIQSGDTGSKPLDGLSFFPYDPGLIENAAPQPVTAQPGPGGTVYQLRIARARMPAGELTRLYGLLVASSGLSRAEGPAAIEVNLPLSRR
jgi:DsbC/DsbD-like thiol-disulfide interchange protein